MNMGTMIRALLATARVANVPSVIVNVLTGMLMIHWWTEASMSPEPRVVIGIVSACLLYISGNFLNDWYDREWDREHRPERAIPSGLIHPRSYLVTAMVMMASGAIMAWWIHASVLAVYLVISILVVSYTLCHKRHTWSIWLMGGCRAGLYLMGMMILSPNLRVLSLLSQAAENPWANCVMVACVLMPMVGMTCYIAGISLLARYESRAVLQPMVKWWAMALLLMPLATHATFFFLVLMTMGWENCEKMAWWGLLPFLFWTVRAVWQSCAVSGKVGRLLAGIVLVDGVYWWSSAITLHVVMGGGQATFSMIPLVALAAALLLQKVAPAT
jgi:4-hydroxybenzoate polyprenyltransferase